MSKAFDQIEKYVLYAVVFLLPFTVLSISTNPYVVTKLAIGAFGVALLLLIKAIRVIVSGKLEIHVGEFDFPVALIALAYILATFFRTPNKMEALLLPGTATAFIIGAFLYFMVNQLKSEGKQGVTLALLTSGGVFALFEIFSALKIFDKIPQLPAYMRTANFSPEGGYLPSAIFLLVLLPLVAKILLSKKDIGMRALVAGLGVVMFAALAINVYYMLPGKPLAPHYPSYNTSWSIAVDALKENPLFGVGPGNYLTAFNRYRPIAYNATNLWGLKFSTASDFYLTLLTETGMLGFAGIILLVYSIYKTAKKDIKEKRLVKWGFSGFADLTSLVLLAVILAFFPATILLIIMLFLLTSFITKTHATTLNLMTQSQASGDSFGEMTSSRLPALIISVPVALLMLFVFYRAGSILGAEYTFKKSVDALGRNEAQNTYNLMASAIKKNPYVDRYHVTFSRVNLLLANSIAQSPAGKDTNGNPAISTDQRNTITTLIQQSISEAKAGVAANPLRSSGWENLGNIYQSIIPFAQGAANFAVQSYSQAITLDPLNPNLRIALGGLFYTNGDYTDAASVLEYAVAIKPDLANGHYNLAYAYQGQKQYDKAVQQMTLVLSLITNKNSQDYQLAKKALDDMQNQQQTAQPAEGQNLTNPQATNNSPAIEPPINLPQDAQPPESPISPTPIPVNGNNTPTGAQVTPTPAQ